MAKNVRSLRVETLENRLNLSTLAGITAPEAGSSVLVRDQATLASTDRISIQGDFFGSKRIQAKATIVKSFSSELDGGRKARTPSTTTPTTTTTTTTTTTPTTTTPAPATITTPPTITNISTTPITWNTTTMVGYTRLKIVGTTGNDSILISQSGTTLTVNANGTTQTINGTFGEIMIYGAAGDDKITVDNTVTAASLLYGGDGNNDLRALGTGKMTIVSIGDGANWCVGNGINTSFWVNQQDGVTASATEIANKAVNRVGEWYQPFTTDKNSADYVQRGLYGQNLKDPTDIGTTKRLPTNGFFGVGPSAKDIEQGSLGDCYFLAPLASLANDSEQLLQNMAVDLGDGTFAVRFVRSGVTSYVRVDADLPAGGWNFGLRYASTSNSTGHLWGAFFEKAYAYYRRGYDTYASLASGNQGAAFSDLGLNNTSLWIPTSTDSAILSAINNALANNKAVAADTNSAVVSGSKVISSHVYSVTGAWRDAATGQVMIKVRNPWGVDGAGLDGADDGYVTLNWSTFQKNFEKLTYLT